jgi:hypothetical protein
MERLVDSTFQVAVILEKVILNVVHIDNLLTHLAKEM